MLISEYTEWTKSFRIKRKSLSPEKAEASYSALGLAGEAGEVAEIIKKMLRDGKLDREDLKLELGDVFYYFITLAELYDLSLFEIIDANVEKLTQRKEMGTLIRR